MRRIAWMLVFAAAAAAGCRAGSRRVGGDAAGADAAAPIAPAAPAAVATVPDLRGLTVSMARAAISSSGYALGSISYVVDSGGHPPGTVVAQRPAHGAPSPRGVSVELRVAAGAGQGETTTAPPPDVGPAPGSWTPGTVPVLAGLSLADATDLAHRAGYEVVVLRVPGRPLGVVLSQDVAAGKAAPAGTPLGLRVAVGGDGPTVSVPRPVASAVSEVTVPGVLDRTSAQAHRILEDAGLSVREERVDTGPEGRVIDQRPSAGERVKKGTEVAIVVPGAAAEAPVAPAAPPVDPSGFVETTGGPIGSPDGPAVQPRRRAPTAATPAAPESPPSVPPVPSAPESPPPVPPVPEIPPAIPPVPPLPPDIPPVPPAPESPPSIPPVPPLPPDVPPVPPVPAEPPAPPASVPPVPSLPPDVPPVPPVPPSEPPALPPVPVAPQPVPHARPKDDLTVPPAPDAPPPVPSLPSAPHVPDVPNVPAPESPPSVPVPAAPESVPPAPVPAPAPGSTSSSPSPSPSDGPIEIPVVSAPADGVTLVGAKVLGVDLAWGEIAGASGYVVEVEELTGEAWTPILRKVVKSSSIAMEIEPADPRNGEFRWRVRTVVGRRGGRAAPWRAMHVR